MMEPAPCPNPEERRRSEILSGILANYTALLPLSQELQQRINGLDLLCEQTDQYFYEHVESLRDPSILKATKTDNLINFALETQAHIKRIKDTLKTLDRVHHSLDFFPWDKRLSLQLREQDIQEGNL